MKALTSEDTRGKLHRQAKNTKTIIEVDDENYSTANWTGDNIDSQIYFSENCW